MAANQPLFYLFIAVTVLLALGYFWGSRKNRNIYRQTFQELIETLQPRDQKFTAIGGVIGYHANIFPKDSKSVRRVDATITLLPRQAWLYYPVSRFFRGFDRLFLTLYLDPSLLQNRQEGHLIEKKYARFKGPKIANRQKLNRETINWNGGQFSLYSGSSRIRQEFKQLLGKKDLPGPIKHIALIPEQDRAFIFMIPRPDAVSRTLPHLLDWLKQLK